jgi:hypothetical protein
MSDEKYCLTFILEKSILANMKQRTNFAKLQKAAPVAAKLLKAIFVSTESNGTECWAIARAFVIKSICFFTASWSAKKTEAS